MSSGNTSKIIALVASAVDSDTLVQFFDAVPSDTADTGNPSVAFLVIPHPATDGPSVIEALSAHRIRLPVVTAETGVHLNPGSIYVCPSDKILSIKGQEGRQLRLSPDPGGSEADFQLDRYFETLAETFGVDAFAVVLSGPGADGTEGAKKVHHSGGRVFVQAPGSAKFPSRPQSAISAGVAHTIAPVGDLWAAIELALHQPSESANLEPSAPTSAQARPLPVADAPDKSDQIRLLEDALRSTRESLEASEKKLLAANMKMQAMSEETQVFNEELRSTNDELRSLNEELTSLNAEFERKNSELISANSSHQNLLESSEDGTLYVDKELRIRRFNSAIANAFNLLPGDIGRPLDQLSYKMGETEPLLDAVRRVLKTGKRIEEEAQSFQGRYYLKRFYPFRDADGVTDGAILTITDVTEIYKLGRRFEFAITAAGISSWEWNLSTDSINIQTAGGCMLGCLEDDALMARDRKAWMEKVHPDDRAHVGQTLDAHLRGESDIWICEHRFLQQSGGWLWVSNRGQVVERDDEGQPLEVIGTVQDIHVFKNTILELAAQMDVLDVASDIAKLGTWIYYVNSEELVWSDQIRRIYAVGADYNPSGPEADSFYPERDRERINAAFREAVASGREYDLELNFIDANGRALIVHTACRVIRDEAGRISQIVGAMQDVTETAEARIRAEKANRSKNEFLAVMSHELRSPLNPIMGFAELLLDDAEDEAQREGLTSILESTEHMVKLIDEILNYARLGANKARFETVEFSLSELLARTVRIMSGQIKESAVTLEWTLDQGSFEATELPTFYGDPSWIGQILRNLVGNAIKFTEEGFIRIRGHVLSAESGVAQILLEVEDSGIGIAPADADRLFHPFTQVDSSATRKYGGTGLGLAISRRLVESMDGTIDLESEPGKGSTFSVRLPLKYDFNPADTETMTEEDPVSHPDHEFEGDKQPKVLVVEDNELNRLFAERLLLRLGCRAVSVADGEAALHALEKDAYDLVLLDLHMPGIGGLEVLAEMRARALIKDEIKTAVVILTADVDEKTRKACVDAGVDAFITKPVAINELRRVLVDILNEVSA